MSAIARRDVFLSAQRHLAHADAQPHYPEQLRVDALNLASKLSALLQDMEQFDACEPPPVAEAACDVEAESNPDWPKVGEWWWDSAGNASYIVGSGLPGGDFIAAHHGHNTILRLHEKSGTSFICELANLVSRMTPAEAAEWEYDADARLVRRREKPDPAAEHESNPDWPRVGEWWWMRNGNAAFVYEETAFNDPDRIHCGDTLRFACNNYKTTCHADGRFWDYTERDNDLVRRMTSEEAAEWEYDADAQLVRRREKPAVEQPPEPLPTVPPMLNRKFRTRDGGSVTIDAFYRNHKYSWKGDNGCSYTNQGSVYQNGQDDKDLVEMLPEETLLESIVVGREELLASIHKTMDFRPVTHTVGCGMSHITTLY